MSTPPDLRGPTPPMAAELLLDVSDHHPFGLHHLPYGVFSPRAEPGRRRLGVRFGEAVVDVGALAAASATPGGHRLPDPLLAAVVGATTLTPLLTLDADAWAELRGWLRHVLSDVPEDAAPHAHDLAEVDLHLPVAGTDVVEPGDDGHHELGGVLVVSGTEVRRPSGPLLDPWAGSPAVGPTRALDLAAGVGLVLGDPTAPGERVPVERAAAHLFGVALLVGWPARDLATAALGPPDLPTGTPTCSMAAWVTPLAALGGTDGPGGPEGAGPDVVLEIRLNRTLLSRPRSADAGWAPAHLLARFTIDGTPVRAGDVLSSGTISGPGDDERGSLLELTRAGTRPVTLGLGGERTCLEDGDAVVVTASAPGASGRRLHLGEVAGVVRPAT